MKATPIRNHSGDYTETPLQLVEHAATILNDMRCVTTKAHLLSLSTGNTHDRAMFDAVAEEFHTLAKQAAAGVGDLNHIIEVMRHLSLNTKK